MQIPHNPRQNHLLAAFPLDEFDRLFAHLELVSLSVGDFLIEADKGFKFAYFPTTAVVSFMYILEDGTAAEIASVGKEGVIGISLVLGEETTPRTVEVQIAGFAYRLKGTILASEFSRAGPVLHLLLRYSQALIIQMTQIAICNRYHSVDQQICRWLLLSLDRSTNDLLYMTQQVIANMLGIRRERVVMAARNLQKDGLIHYSRGTIEVLSRLGLEKTVCERNGVIRTELDRLKSDVPMDNIILNA